MLSANENKQVIFNIRYSLLQKIKVMAHELYGHAYFKIQGKWHSHGERIREGEPGYNMELETFIRKVENEALSFN